MSIIDSKIAAILTTWDNAKTALKAAQQAETDARAAVWQACFPHMTPQDSGTQYYELASGYKLKGVFKVHHNVQKDALPEVLLALSDMGEAGSHAADTCFRYKPELSLTAYKNLMPSIAVVVDRAIVSTPATPSFEIVEPKPGKVTK